MQARPVHWGRQWELSGLQAAERRVHPWDEGGAKRRSARSGAGAFGDYSGYAVGIFPGNPRDIAPRKPDVGQFAIAEPIELVEPGIVALPGTKEVDDCG
jgi:hypothetical protein